MTFLPFALLHQDDFEKKMKERLEKKASCDSECSTSCGSTNSRSNSADSSPCSSECSSDITDFGLEKSSSPEGGKNELEAFRLIPIEEQTNKQVLAACRWTTKVLVERQILMEGEDIVLCGNILQRRFLFLKNNVLMLTNMPRLLVLDPSACEILKQIPLRSDGTSIAKQGPHVFQVSTCDEIYKCRDAIVGADVWKNSVQAAREKIKHGRFF